MDEQESADGAARYRAGGMGYGDVKKRLAAAIIDYFAPYREVRKSLAADPVKLEEIRRAGAERARKTARIVLERARRASGLGS